MKKEKYERTELDVSRFQTEDVIMTSGESYDDTDEYEWIVPNH